MNPQQFIQILTQSANLKKNTRHCWIDSDRKESVADHSWRISLMAMLLSHEEEFQDYDMNKVVRMCMIHDLGESFTGDIPTFEKTEDDNQTEEDILIQWVKTFPDEVKEEWLCLYQEMIELQTNEAKLYKALDKLEALISHNESDLSTWLPLEYDLQLTYGKENMEFSKTLVEIRKYVDDWTLQKIKEG